MIHGLYWKSSKKNAWFGIFYLWYLLRLRVRKFVHTNLSQAGFELGSLGLQAHGEPIDLPLFILTNTVRGVVVESLFEKSKTTSRFPLFIYSVGAKRRNGRKKVNENDRYWRVCATKLHTYQWKALIWCQKNERIFVRSVSCCFHISVSFWCTLWQALAKTPFHTLCILLIVFYSLFSVNYYIKCATVGFTSSLCFFNCNCLTMLAF